MKIVEICWCSVLTILGILLIVTSFIGGISYFKLAPSVPIYFGVLFLSLAGIAWTVSVAKQKEDY